ncbi:MAG: cation-transporting P-type ATPase [Candidatus Eisenbacteria bacterium]|nr:cation-transporting P-type ATPase [Candidatus Eisenbacteria bacterium]
MPERQYFQMTVQEALDSLGTTPKGLPREEAEKRLSEHGPNELTAEFDVPKWVLLLSQFKDLLVLVLIIAAVISFAIGSVRDGAVMLAIVVVNAVIGFVQEYKAQRIVDSLKSLISSPAKIVVEGELSEVSQEKLVPGDIVHIEAGDRIPADLRIIESFDLRTNDFSLTGESTPQGKSTNAIADAAVIGDRDNMAHVGTTAASGTATGVVTATGMNTEMGKIANMTQETTETESPLEKELGALARWLTTIVAVIGTVLFVVAMWQGFGLLTSMIYALGIAVALVPQALPAQVTIAMSATSKRLAEQRAVVKSLPAVETLGSTSVICTDKTGTLTKNEMTVTNVWFNGKKFSLTGVGYEPEGEILGDDDAALTQEQVDEIEIMMDAATMASNAEIHKPDEEHDGWYPVGDPTEAALVAMSTKLGTRSPTEDEENPELQEFPFDSERKRMSSVREFGEHKQLAMKGAPDSVLAISKSIYRDGKAVPITDEDRAAITAAVEDYSKDALRVLAIAFRPLGRDDRDYTMEEVERDVTFLGLAGMIDPPKEGVREAIADCHTAHIRTFIMTGDHAITAQAVGREIGLAEEGVVPPVVTGQELHAMSDSVLTSTMEENDAMVFSRVDPEDKLRIVKLLGAQHEVVAVTGDGVNDAPALKRADIGVAMGKIGTDVAKEASELVLLDDSFPTLVEAVREGRTIYENLKKTVLASMTTNAAELAVVLLGLAAVSLRNWAIPILAIQILAIDLLAEILPLTALTFDPAHDEIMTVPPRDLKAHILNRATSTEVVLLGFFMGALAFANFGLFMWRNGITLTVDHSEAFLYARATTVTYLTIAYCQFINVLSRRYERTSIFARNFWANRTLLWSIVFSITLTSIAVYGPFISEWLAFARLSAIDWVYVLGGAGVYLAAFEIMKLAKRMRAARAERTTITA